MMRRLALLLALSATVVLLGNDAAWAARRGCGGGRGGCGGGGGHSRGGCHSGGCGGQASHGCSTCSTGGCAGSVCGVGTGTAVAEGTAPVTIIVSLPADAKLSVDGQPTTSTSATRMFYSPPLQIGSDYSYTLKAELVRDGQTNSVTKQITVRPGEETRVTLEVPVSGVAAR